MPFILKKILISEQMVFLYNHILSSFFILLLFLSGKTDTLYIEVVVYGLIVSFLFNIFSILKYFINKEIRSISVHSVLASSFNFIFIGFSIYFMHSSDNIDIFTGFFSIFVLFVSFGIILLDRYMYQQDISHILNLKLLINNHLDKTEPSFKNVVTYDKVWEFKEKKEEYLYFNNYIFNKHEGLIIDNLIIPYSLIKDYLEIKDCLFSLLTKEDIEVLKMYSI